MELNFLQPTGFVYLAGLVAFYFIIDGIKKCNTRAMVDFFIAGFIISAGAHFKSVALFYLVGGIALAVYFLLDNVVRSPIGETLRAIREDEVSAASLGINAARWKAFAFGLGAAIAGLAGCFYPGFVGTLVPEAFNIVESFTMLAMVIVGGMGTMIGPVIGAVVLTFLPELLRGIGELRLLVYGLALTLVVLFMPGGIVQAWSALWRKRS